jgi:parallel beta-helix repeat protein
MKRLNLLCGIFILLVLSLPIGNLSNGLESFENNQAIDTITLNLSYTSSVPILIQSDADFETQGWPGVGTEESPYLIANLSISSTSDCITIKDTTAYFVIRNCTLSSSEETYEIYFSHVVNGIIEMCVINRNTLGIQLSYCNNCSIVNNTLTDISYDGIEIKYSNNCTLAYNSILNCTGSGVAVISSTGCTLKNNTFVNDGPTLHGTSFESWIHSFVNNTVDGKQFGYFVGVNDTIIECASYGQVIIVDCRNVTLTDGIFVNSSIGAQIAFSERCVFLRNVISNSNCEGMHLIDSINCSLIQNNISDNYGRGVFGRGSPNCVLFNNSICDNSDRAIHLVGSNGIVLEKNTMLNNLGAVTIWQSNSCLVFDNFLSGLQLQNSDDSTIFNNKIQNSPWIGLNLYMCNNCNSENNIVTNSGSHGVEIDLCKNCAFSDNVVNSSSGDGIRDIFSSQITITGNNITENTQLGIWLYGSSEMLLYNNRIGWNGGGNAKDDGSDNQWDDGISVGNYWSDYDGYGEYVIVGDAGSSDRFPFSLGNAPFLDHPADIEYVFGTEGHSISWNPSDSNPESYELFRNSTLLTSEAWTGLSLTFDVDGLDAGAHNYTLIVFDEQGNWVADTVMIYVKASTTTSTPITTPIELDPILTILLGVGVIGAIVVLAMILKVRAR